MLYLGIDNGASGGIAALTEDGMVYRADPMPPTDADLYALLALFGSSAVKGRAVAMLEFAHSMPKQGHNGAFTYGRGYGAVQMALHAAWIPFDIVTPRKWQAAMGCLSGGDKNVTKRRAQQLFPEEKITHALADALLLAAYCRTVKR